MNNYKDIYENLKSLLDKETLTDDEKRSIKDALELLKVAKNRNDALQVINFLASLFNVSTKLIDT